MSEVYLTVPLRRSRLTLLRIHKSIVIEGLHEGLSIEEIQKKLKEQAFFFVGKKMLRDFIERECQDYELEYLWNNAFEFKEPGEKFREEVFVRIVLEAGYDVKKVRNFLEGKGCNKKSIEKIIERVRRKLVVEKG